METITVRFFAGARAAAGVAETALPAGCTLEEMVAALGDRHGPRLAAVLASASFLVDGVPYRERAQPLPGATIDVLPPFAGG